MHAGLFGRFKEKWKKQRKQQRNVENTDGGTFSDEQSFFFKC